MLAIALAMATACSRQNPAYLGPLGADAAVPKDSAADRAIVADTQADIMAPPDLADTADATALPGTVDTMPLADVAPDLTPDVTPDLAPDLPPAAPPRVMFGASSPTTRRGGTTGYYTMTDQCGPDEAVVGYHGAVSGNLVGGLQLVCARLTFSSPAPGTPVTISNYRPLTRRGNMSTGWMELCMAGQVVAGYAGRSKTLLDNVEFRCSSLTIASDGRSLAVGTTFTALGPHGGAGGDPFADPCPTGQVMHGAITQYGSVIDAFQALCATPMLVP